MRRREVLQAFLGLPAALAACRRGSATPASPRGDFASHSERLGHRLRDLAVAPGGAGLIEPPPERWERAGVVIVGGGVAGLAAAWRLASAGMHDFVLLEIDPVLGGTARSGRSAVGAHPWGAHYITAPMQHDRAMVRLLGELGILDGVDERGDPVIAEQHMCRDPSERLFYRGHWYADTYLYAGASAADLAQYAAFEAEVGRLATLRDSRGRRAFAIPVAAGSDDVEITALDRITMAAWMDARGFTSPRLRWYVDYACRDDYGLRMEHTSAWAGLLYFAGRVATAGSDYRPVVTWPEGNGRLVAHLAGRIGPRARSGWGVAELRPRAQPDGTGHAGVDVVALIEDGAAAAGIHADRVIFAAPHFLTPYLVRSYRDDPPAHVAAFDYGSWMVANLHLRDRPQGNLGFPLAWDNVLYDSPSLGYVVSTHQRGLDHGPTVITYYYPLADPDSRAARNKLLEAGWADWVDVALTDLERAHRDIRTLAERVDIMRWGHAMVRPRPGFVWGGARQAAARPFRGIHFAHSDLGGVALFEEALDQGVRAAAEVLAARGLASVATGGESWR